MANGYWRTNGGVITSYTAAQLAAMALAGELTQYTTYIASDTGGRYQADDASTLTPISLRGVRERRWADKRDEALRAIADVTAGVGGKAWEANVTISAAGTYEGRYFKTLTTNPACKVTTSNPVVFRNCIFWSATAAGINTGQPVYTGNGGGVYSNATFQNCIFLSSFNDSANKSRMRSSVDRPEEMEFSNCTFIGAGIIVANTATVTKFLFKNNFAYNIDYRQSNGAAAYNGSKHLYCWVQIHTIGGMTGVVFEGNEYVGLPYDASRPDDFGCCEDVFNFYGSGGTTDDWCKVRNNMFYGNYSVVNGIPTAVHASSAAVQTEAVAPTTPSHYILIEHNRVISCNAGLSLNGIHDGLVQYNTILGSGYVITGAANQVIYSLAYGLQSGNYYSVASTYIYNRTFQYNTVGQWRRAGSEGGGSDFDAAYYHNEAVGEDAPIYTGNTELAIVDCTAAAEEALYQEWLDECVATGREVGFSA